MNRDAAAVMLIEGEGSEIRVYLVERSPELRFFGGYLALPGGVLSPTDGNGNSEDALRRCAIRELFEETGILLADTGLDSSALAHLRSRLLDRTGSESSAAIEFHSHCKPAHPATLSDLCKIRTPPFAPVRYDTLFTLARLPVGAEPQIIRGELVGGRFWRPQEALVAWQRGEILIVPPVVILLQLLLHHGVDAFSAQAQSLAQRYHDGELHRVYFSPGVLMASLPTPTLPPATTTNCYIVGSQRLLVIDPGPPKSADQQRLFDLLDALRREGHELDSVVLTHHHNDHIGAVHAVSQRYDLPVHGHATTLDRLRPGFRVGRAIQDGDRFDLGKAPDGSADWYLRAVFTPGHDRGHLCFWDSRYHSMIVGDMLSTVSTIVIDPPEGHMRTYLQSLERLLSEPITTLYPAHGPAARDGHRLVRQYLRHRLQRESGLIEALRKGPASLDTLLPMVYWDVDRKMYPVAKRSLFAGLEKLREDGLADLRGEQWHLVQALT